VLLNLVRLLLLQLQPLHLHLLLHRQLQPLHLHVLPPLCLFEVVLFLVRLLLLQLQPLHLHLRHAFEGIRRTLPLSHRLTHTLGSRLDHRR
jgi:hypothetical protein